MRKLARCFPIAIVTCRCRDKVCLISTLSLLFSFFFQGKKEVIWHCFTKNRFTILCMSCIMLEAMAWISQGQ